jgi:putative transposase
VCWQDSLRWCHASKKSGLTKPIGGQALFDWCKAEGDWDLEVVERDPGVRGFSLEPRRCVVERTFGWLSRSRHLSKDYERKVQTSEILIEVAMIRVLLTRLGRGK